MARTAPPIDTLHTSFVWFWIISFLPYLAASFLVLATPPAPRRWRRVELGVILGGALLLRAFVLPILPNLSHDSWRYLWDARVTLHGYSPYVYAPGDSLFARLQDFVYTNSRYRNVPSIYPPVAQAIYLLSYLLAPSNLYVLKAIFVGFELVTCGALAYLLYRRGLDPARCIIYAWCPLPIIEFALQGHLDALTLTFMVCAMLCALSNRREMRILTGFFLALATLTKIYPIVLIFAVVRRRDWALLATCLVTIILAYMPYLILGHGQVLGFFASYTSEHTPNAGIVQHMVDWLLADSRLPGKTILILEYLTDLIVMGVVALVVLWLRLRERISMEAATLLLIGAIFSISSHIFPWYTAALLPWIAVLVGPLWSRGKGMSGKGLAIVSAWYFVCITVTAYFFDTTIDWNVYYILAYAVPLSGLAAASLIGIARWRKGKIAIY